MRVKLITVAVAAAVATWAPLGSAREAVVLPGVVTATGELAGVDTTGAGILTVGDGQNINTSNDLGGAFRTNANDTGIINFTGNSTVTGSTGQTGTEYDIINAGAVGRTVNFNGAIFSRILNVSGTGTVNLNGNVIAAPNFVGDGFMNLGAGLSLIGAITTNTANTGTLTLNNGSSVTGAIGGASGLRAINVVGGNASVTGAVQAKGFSLGINTLTINGALTTNAAGTISTTIASDAVFGKINVTGSSNINAGGVTVIPTVTGVVTSGTTYRIVSAGVGTDNAVVSVINNSPRYTFSGLPTTLGSVDIVLASQIPLVDIVTDAAASEVAPILEVTAALGTDLRVVQDALAVLPTASAISAALAQLAPSRANMAAPWVAQKATRLFEGLWMSRLDDISCCDASCEPDKTARPNVARDCEAGERNKNWWVRGFGSRGEQDDVQNMSGYDTNSVGLMLAYDVPVTEQTRAGLGAGYARTNIDGNNIPNHAKIDSYQLMGYLHYEPGPFFVQASVAAGIDKYEGSRTISFPGVNRKATADYDGQQYTGMVGVGKHFQLQDLTVTPLASLEASHIRVENYKERGAGDVNLRVDSQRYNFLQSTVGVKAERVFQSGNASYTPELHFKWMRDYNSTTMEQDVTFVGGGATVTARGIKHDRDLYNFGGGLTFLSCNCDKNSWTVKGMYDYKWNDSDYSSQQVSLIAGFEF